MQNQSAIFTQDANTCNADNATVALPRDLDFTEIMAIGGGETIHNNL
jgi:hypothetical protein